MKKITGLNDRLEHFEDLDETQALTLPTVRTALVRQMANFAPVRNDLAEEFLAAFEIGNKIRKCPLDFLELEDADFRVVESAVRSNRAAFIAHYQGQLLLRLKAWEK